MDQLNCHAFLYIGGGNVHAFNILSHLFARKVLFLNKNDVIKLGSVLYLEVVSCQQCSEQKGRSWNLGNGHIVYVVVVR